MRISGKNIWVVGASTGIGLELAHGFAKQGNFVYVTARSADKLVALKKAYPNAISVLDGDITSTSERSALHSRLIEQTDVLDLVVLCAGTCIYDDGPSLDIDIYYKTFDLNFFAQIHCVKMALPLLEATSGTIVGVSSLASVVPFPRAEAYGSSKAALEYFLSSLKIDLHDRNIDVVIVKPGFVDTPLTQKNDFDMPFMCDSQTAADKIIRGLEKGKSTISFPWQMSWILGFFSLFQSLWEQKIAVKFKKNQKI